MCAATAVVAATRPVAPLSSPPLPPRLPPPLACASPIHGSLERHASQVSCYLLVLAHGVYNYPPQLAFAAAGTASALFTAHHHRRHTVFSRNCLRRPIDVVATIAAAVLSIHRRSRHRSHRRRRPVAGLPPGPQRITAAGASGTAAGTQLASAARCRARSASDRRQHYSSINTLVHVCGGELPAITAAAAATVAVASSRPNTFPAQFEILVSQATSSSAHVRYIYQPATLAALASSFGPVERSAAAVRARRTPVHRFLGHVRPLTVTTPKSRQT